MIEQYIRQIRSFSNLEPTTCLEIGALDGEYSHVLAEAFDLEPSDLILVEPNPELYPKLLERFPGSLVLPAAIADRDGKRTLRVVDSHERHKIGCSSLLDRIDGWADQLERRPITVEALRGASLLERIGKPIDLCVLDVEGFTYEVLLSFGPGLREIRSFLLECEHAELFAGQKLFKQVADLLTQQGFHMMAFQYAYANQSDSVWIRNELVDLEF